MRFHVVSLPNTQTTDEYYWSPYTQKVRQFCNMMSYNEENEVFLYGGEENDCNVTVHFPCISESERQEYFPERFPSFDPQSPGRKLFTRRVLEVMTSGWARPGWARPGDILCLTEGAVQAGIMLNHPEMTPVEIGVGYEATCTQRRIFESYAWQHAHYAMTGGGAHSAKGGFLDAVFPNAYDEDDFPLGTHDGGYLLFVGRITINKGIEIAQDVAEATGYKLVVAGQGDLSLLNKATEYVGEVNIKERAALMGKAMGLIAPTLNMEPFGGTVVEAQLCGTPVITTDWGAYAETVEHPITGVRCRLLSEYVEAVHSMPEFNHPYIQKRAQSLYSTLAIWEDLEYYFERVTSPPDSSVQPPKSPPE